MVDTYFLYTLKFWKISGAEFEPEEGGAPSSGSFVSEPHLS